MTDDGKLVVHLDNFQHPRLKQLERQVLGKTVTGWLGQYTLRAEIHPKTGSVDPNFLSHVMKISPNAIPLQDVVKTLGDFLSKLNTGQFQVKNIFKS